MTAREPQNLRRGPLRDQFDRNRVTAVGATLRSDTPSSLE